MSQFIPLNALEKQAATPRAFELWLPNPVMAKALFLRLPLDRGWAFEFNPEKTEASRYMVYRDSMWVSEGKARFFAVRIDGSRVEVSVRVKRWKPRSQECHHSMVGRRPLRLLWGAAEESMESRCCRTAREITAVWKAEDARSVPGPDVGGNPELAQSDIEAILSELRCH